MSQQLIAKPGMYLFNGNAYGTVIILPDGADSTVWQDVTEEALPAEAEKYELPELTNEATASELFADKELIDGKGNKVTGTFTIDSELSEQDDIIAQIQAALEGKAGGATAIEPTLQEKTVSPTTDSQSITPDSGYDGLSKVTVNAMPTATQATPSISVNSNGLITASATQDAGYVDAGTTSATKQLATKGYTVITPTESSQTVVPVGIYTTGDVMVDAIPSNYRDTTPVTATRNDVMAGKIFVDANGSSTGTFTIDDELNDQIDLIAQLRVALSGKAAGGNSEGTNWISIAQLPQVIADLPGYEGPSTPGGDSTGTDELVTVYYEIPENCFAVFVTHKVSHSFCVSIRYSGISSISSFSTTSIGSMVTVTDSDGTGTALQIGVNPEQAPAIYLLPIYNIPN